MLLDVGAQLQPNKFISGPQASDRMHMLELLLLLEAKLHRISGQGRMAARGTHTTPLLWLLEGTWQARQSSTYWIAKPVTMRQLEAVTAGSLYNAWGGSTILHAGMHDQQ